MGNCCSGGKEESKASAFATATTGGGSDYSDHQIADPLSSTEADAVGGATDFPGLPPSSSSTGALAQDALNNNNNNSGAPNNSNNNSDSTAANEAQLQLQREEQNRLEVIVQMAGRGMVSVRSTRGSTGYFDQGFAAALGQHLEQTTTFPDRLPIRLPSTSTSSNNKTSSSSAASSSSKEKKSTTVFQRLSQPTWDNIALGNKGTGLAGCGGENPSTYMDHVAVSVLDSVVPKKERIFQERQPLQVVQNSGTGGGAGSSSATGGSVGPMVENLL